MLRFGDVKRFCLTSPLFCGILNKLSSDFACGGVGMADVEDRVAITWLMDFYGPLLTEHRREVARLYCEEDLSLSEQLGITRQGVSDALRKARAQLIDYEEKLGLAARYRALTDQAEICMRSIAALKVQPGCEAQLETARQALTELLRIER